MEIGNKILYKIFCCKPADTRDKARIDDLGRQAVVDGGKEPRFRSTISCIYRSPEVALENQDAID